MSRVGKEPWLTPSGQFRVRTTTAIAKYLAAKTPIYNVECHNCGSYVLIIYCVNSGHKDYPDSRMYRHCIPIPCKTLYMFKEKDFEEFIEFTRLMHITVKEAIQGRLDILSTDDSLENPQENS